MAYEVQDSIKKSFSSHEKALKKRKMGLKKDYNGVHPLAEHKSLRRNIAKQH